MGQTQDRDAEGTDPAGVAKRAAAVPGASTPAEPAVGAGARRASEPADARATTPSGTAVEPTAPATESAAAVDESDESAGGPERLRRHVLVQATVPPLDEDGRSAALVGTIGFALASLILFGYEFRHTRGGETWGLWVCLAGLGIGLIFVAYCELRLWLRAQQEAEREQTDGETKTPR